MKIQRLDDEFAAQSQKVNEQKDLVDKLRASVDAEKFELEKSRQDLVSEKSRVSRDLAHIERLKEDIERQSRSVTEDKILINSERQILSKISAEINEKEAQMAQKREELQSTKENVEKNMERLATERVEIAYQLKVLTDERLKASAAAKEAREAEVELRSRLRQPPKKRSFRTKGTQRWPTRPGKPDSGDRGLSYNLRMQLLMAELERERQAIAHDKKRNNFLLESQEKFLYEAKTDLLKYHTRGLDKGGIWSTAAKNYETQGVMEQRSGFQTPCSQ